MTIEFQKLLSVSIKFESGISATNEKSKPVAQKTSVAGGVTCGIMLSAPVFPFQMMAMVLMWGSLHATGRNTLPARCTV